MYSHVIRLSCSRPALLCCWNRTGCRGQANAACPSPSCSAALQMQIIPKKIQVSFYHFRADCVISTPVFTQHVAPHTQLRSNQSVLSNTELEHHGCCCDYCIFCKASNCKACEGEGLCSNSCAVSLPLESAPVCAPLSRSPLRTCAALPGMLPGRSTSMMEVAVALVLPCDLVLRRVSYPCFHRLNAETGLRNLCRLGCKQGTASGP